MAPGRLTLALLLLGVAPLAAQPLCGDCNGDGVVSILDALQGAQHAASLTTLTGSEFTRCNVTGALEPDPAAAVSILDALTIAQYAAGMPVTLTCAALGPPQGWGLATPGLSPPARRWHAMAYLPSPSTIVLFGGVSASGNLLADTWVWDGVDWTQRFPSPSPPPRRRHALAGDEGRGVVVLFGGTGSGPLSDTWEWDGASWRNALPATDPGERKGHAMTYDPTRGVVRLCGGSTHLSTLLEIDTWEWDGVTWTEVGPASPTPQGRAAHAYAHDPGSGRTILHGGYVAAGTSAETWEWDGVDWTTRSPIPSPGLRQAGAMVTDQGRGGCLFFGGTYQGPSGWLLADDTWEWSGLAWTQLPAGGGPSPRQDHAMAYDAARGVTVLFGGETGAGTDGETWEFH